MCNAGCTDRHLLLVYSLQELDTEYCLLIANLEVCLTEINMITGRQRCTQVYVTPSACCLNIQTAAKHAGVPRVCLQG